MADEKSLESNSNIIGINDQIRYGILGCAAIASKIARAILLSKTSRITMVASRNKTKGLNFIKIHCPNAKYCTYNELIKSNNIDVIYIALPTSLRLTWIVKAIENRKHIICEKPIGSPKYVELIIPSCRAKNVQFMDGISFMHHIRFKELTNKIHKQKCIGNIMRVNSSFSIKCLDPNNIRNKPNLEPLGCLGDLGICCIRITLWAFDYETPRYVKALCHRRDPKTAAIQDISVWLFFSKDRVASFDCSYFLPLRQHCEIVGETGTINIREFVVPNEKLCNYTINYSFQNIYDTTEIIKQYNYYNDCQELNMINRMSKILKTKKIEQFWPSITLITEKILDACRRSIDKDGALVEFIKGQLWFEMTKNDDNNKRRYSVVGNNHDIFNQLNKYKINDVVNINDNNKTNNNNNNNINDNNNIIPNDEKIDDNNLETNSNINIDSNIINVNLQENVSPNNINTINGDTKSELINGGNNDIEDNTLSTSQEF